MLKAFAFGILNFLATFYRYQIRSLNVKNCPIKSIIIKAFKYKFKTGLIIAQSLNTFYTKKLNLILMLNALPSFLARFLTALFTVCHNLFS